MSHASTSDIRNLVLTVVISMLFLFAWHHFVDAPRIQKTQEAAATYSHTVSSSETETPNPNAKPEIIDRDRALLSQPQRVKINTQQLHGSISLKGLRIDDLTLATYKQTLEHDAKEVELLSPSPTSRSYFIDLGWVSTTPGIQLPGKDTVWQSNSNELTATNPVKLTWANPQGVAFEVTISIDDHYLFSIERKVINHSQTSLSIQSFSAINRTHDSYNPALAPHTRDTSSIMYEGPLGVLSNKLEEFPYEDIMEKKSIQYLNAKGWVGFDDKYWLTALIPSQQDTVNARFNYAHRNGRERYQADLTWPEHTIAPNQQYQDSSHIFTGAKKVKLLDQYGLQYNIPLFDRAVDFGRLYFLTKPIFLLLQYFYSEINNFGLCILLLTVVVKLVLFPIANKSYETMSHMKQVQPKLAALKEKHKTDKMALNKAVAELYKKEKLNPAFGCLGMLIQLPIAFALYKVLYVAIEMRHAPFYGWITDLSAPDPTSIFNLFGLIPWTPPLFMQIGAWPLIFSLTMYVQQLLQPTPSDPIQANMMKILPLFLLFVFATLPSGLVIYFVWSNLLSIIQQKYISHRVEKKVNKIHATHSKKHA
ncbi:MAG: membrane protein insertase YidC [Alphaproteobacteria bacterium]|nr:membrane protein insertase YidC [Alphaproteobacteria bacterium]